MADSEATHKPKHSKKKTCGDLIQSPSFLIYINFLCSSWGDWMWLFASGLYLVHLDDGRLRLAAGFGFAGGSCVLLFGGLIGEWVDRHQRLFVIRVSLFIQNTSVMLSAVCVGVSLYLEQVDSPYWFTTLRQVLEASIVIFAIMAQLASIAYKISIEKDWIVVVARGNKSTLANLNAVIRAIDLTAKILAPTCVGLIMTYVSLMVSAIVIAAWNVVSVFLEYGMLSIVYRRVPELANKKVRTSAPAAEKEMEDIKPTTEEAEPINRGTEIGVEPDNQGEAGSVQNGSLKPDSEKQPLKEDTTAVKVDESVVGKSTKEKAPAVSKKSRCPESFRTMFEPIVLLVEGWRTYARQKVVYAGLALATLYMTVMGFDSVTTGYIYSSGGASITEWVVGLSMALAGVTGIASTFIFTRLRRKVGLERTGLIAFNMEILCLTFAVASVWAPGSPFDIHFASRLTNCTSLSNSTVEDQKVQAGVFRIDENKFEQRGNESHSRGRRDLGLTSMDHLGDLDMILKGMESRLLRVRRQSLDEGIDIEPLLSVDHSGKGDGSKDIKKDVQEECKKPGSYQGVNISIILFLIGIITSRTGLWMADLVVTQLLQENVVETERGVVNGVQNSLNMLMEMTKFVLVIVAPHVETFGILIIISFLFICLAGIFFATHSYRVRGHLFHFEKCLCYNNNFGPRQEEDDAMFRNPAVPARV